MLELDNVRLWSFTNKGIEIKDKTSKSDEKLEKRKDEEKSKEDY